MLCRLRVCQGPLATYSGSQFATFFEDMPDSCSVLPLQLAVELVLQSEPLDPNRIALLGGSHGGFICCHLIGRYPKMYKACAVRSPVVNMATLLGTSDIPDW